MTSELCYRRDGAEYFAGMASPDLAAIEDLLSTYPRGLAGIRISRNPRLRDILSPPSPIGKLAAEMMGEECQPVRAILFDKSPSNNWSLGWHQDRTIAVRRKTEVEGYGPWTVKQGMHHVEPPFEVIENMITVRIHLDDVPADNAPLIIAPGSHRLGKIMEADIEGHVGNCGRATCLAQAGDIWLYATSILHASEASETAGNCRVLQVDYSAESLPGELEWLGI